MKVPMRVFKCLDCGEEFEVPFGKPKWMLSCPSCESDAIVRIGSKNLDSETLENGEDVVCCGFGGWRFRGGFGRRRLFSRRGRGRFGRRWW